MIGYNRMTGYNIARYNAEGTEIQVTDTVTLTGAITRSSQKTLTGLIVLGESIAKQQNKSVTESLRLQDWTRIKKDQPDPWSD